MSNPILLVQNAGYGDTPVPADALLQPGAEMVINDENDGSKTTRRTDALAERLQRVGERVKPRYQALLRTRRFSARQEAAVEAGGGYIYFVDCGDFTKIGFSANPPTQRTEALQTANPHDLLMWGHARGPAELERHIHKWLSSARVKGEWFRLSSDHRRELARLARRTGGRAKRMPDIRSPKQPSAAEVQLWLIP